MSDHVSLARRIIRNSEADRLRRFQFERYKEIGRLYRQGGWLVSLQDLAG